MDFPIDIERSATVGCDRQFARLRGSEFPYRVWVGGMSENGRDIWSAWDYVCPGNLSEHTMRRRGEKYILNGSLCYFGIVRTVGTQV